LVFEKNVNIFAENWQKLQKIVIPGFHMAFVNTYIKVLFPAKWGFISVDGGMVFSSRKKFQTQNLQAAHSIGLYEVQVENFQTSDFEVNFTSVL
jgi:hypothetical protein